VIFEEIPERQAWQHLLRNPGRSRSGINYFYPAVTWAARVPGDDQDGFATATRLQSSGSDCLDIDQVVINGPRTTL
jgi:hypothetical protein